ncbi:MAG TPA: hypothetical protein DCP63_03910 [Bacteroidetes bacterium]|nr:hypothetical protein [Bacteroidota bacterium]
MRSGTLRVLILALIAFVLPSCDSPISDELESAGETYKHIRASWSPDGKWIAYTSMIEGDLGIYLVDSSGSNGRRIVEGEGVGVTWSPEARWLAFSRAAGLYRVKSNGDSLFRFNLSAGAIRPSWSKDGDKIAFVRLEPADLHGVWLFRSGAQTSSRLISYGDFPSWHRDNKQVYFLDVQYDAVATTYVSEVLTIHVDTYAMNTVARITSRSDVTFPSMNVSGSSMIYSSKPFDAYAQVWKYDIAEKRLIRLTDDGGDYPAWNPEGTRIVYTRPMKGDGGLWVMNSDGTGKRRLTSP